MVDIVARLKIRAEEFSRGADAAFGRLEQSAAKAGDRAGEDFAQGLSRRLDAMATGAGVAAVVALGKRALDHVTDLKKESAQLGINTQALQEYRYAASDVGVEQDALSDSFTDLTQKMGQARAGNKEAGKAFRDIGIDIESANGRGKDMATVFDELIDRMSQIQDPSERARLEAQLFGDQWQKIDPMLRAGAGRIDGLRQAAHDLGVVISDEAIQNADQTAHKLNQMKMVLEANIAATVAENADAILGLANSLTRMAGSLATWWNQNPQEAFAVMGAGGGARLGFMVGGGAGAVVGAGVGYVAGSAYGKQEKRAADDANTDLAFRRQQLLNAKKERDAMRAAGESGAVVSLRRGGSDRSGATVAQANAEIVRQAQLLWRATQPKPVSPTTRINMPWANGPDIPAEAVSGAGAGGGRSSSGGARAASSGQSDADRALQRQQEAEDRLRKSLEETITRQRDSAQLADMRARGLDREADLQEAMLEVARQFPGLETANNAEAAKALGIREEQVDGLREHYALLKAIRTAEVDKDHVDREAKATVEAAKKAQEEIDRLQEESAERQRRSVEDLSRVYLDLFSGRSGDIWRNFKQEGLEVISLLAAQWTVAMMTGQKFDPATALSGAGMTGSGGPASAMFGALFNGRGRGSSLAELAKAEGGDAGQIASAVGLEKGLGETSKQLGGLNKYLAGVGAGQAVSSLAGAIGIKQNSTAATAGSLIGTAVGGPIGGAIGGLVAGTLGGMLQKSRSAGATITGVDSVSVGGKDKKQYGVATDLSDSVVSGLQDLAAQLGGTVGSFRTTIGVRDGDYRVNTDGDSLKIKNGAVEFDDDAQAAISFAIADAVADGAIQGISAASQRILTSGQDMGDAVRKAALIEAIPDALQSRLDPVGFAIDQLNDKWKETIAALEEGGASTEQMADAQKLYKMELEDVKSSTAGAAKGLKDFLAEMNAGSASPLSLRDQEKAAYSALNPYLDQIKGGSAIDQAAYLDAAQKWLDIKRQLDGSTSQYFEAFDSIQAATNAAIASIDNTASIRTTQDPFTEKTATAAASTAADTANMVTLLQQQNMLLQQMLSGQGDSGSAFIGTGRNFV